MKKSFLKKTMLKREHGQSLVETALVLPIFILILCGILDFGWLFTNQLMINNSSREAARAGIVNYEDNDAAYPAYKTLVEDKAKQMIFFGNASDLNVEVTVNDDETEVTVLVEDTIPLLTPIVGAFYSNNQAKLVSSTTMRLG